MKKTLQSEIKKLAAQITAAPEDFNTREMKKTVGGLFEKLIILEHLENQVGISSETEQQESLDSKSYREDNWFKEPEPLPQSSHKEDLVEPLMEKIKDLVAQMPAESQQMDELLEEVLPKAKYVKNDLEEFAANYQQTPTFERKATETSKPAAEERKPSKGGDIPKPSTTLINDLDISEKPKSLNQVANHSSKIGLNDRLAFIKHLFDGNAEDYTRVLSQINTMQNFEQAATFIKGQVKPDYNYWLNKDDYSTRFMTCIERQFQK